MNENNKNKGTISTKIIYAVTNARHISAHKKDMEERQMIIKL